MVREENAVADGADEQMLGEGEEKLTERRDEVKFIKGDQQNGDAKIDIGNLNGGKPGFTGMSKEELMKYANDPFWVRLRWIFFVAFWAIWVAMLVGAILIIIGAPKCAAPQPLPWYKRGLHAKFGSIDAAVSGDIAIAQKLQAAGAIYELPAAQTYSVRQPEVEAKIRQVVEQYKGSDVHVILDLTPNYISRDSQLFKEALDNEDKRGAFIWNTPSAGAEPPTHWLKIGGNRSAWEKVDNHYVLSQFEDGYFDLQMNHSIVRNELGGALRHLVELGVEGFRLKNTKFFLLSAELKNEELSHIEKDFGHDMSEYGFYNHAQTTFQSGLGDVLYDYLSVVKNASSNAFLSVAEDIIRPEAYELSNAGGSLGIDLPMYGQFVKTFSSSKQEKRLQLELSRTLAEAGNGSWLQWNFADVYIDTPVDLSAFALFMSLLPGVPVVPVDSIEYQNVTAQTYKNIQQLRLSASYMHGDLKIYESESLVAYSRLKSGNPGYFVVFNPTTQVQSGNFTNAEDLPDKMTVLYLSENYLTNNATVLKIRAQLPISDLYLDAYSTAILTYVPKA